MAARKRKLERIIDRLKEVERSSTMKNANFDLLSRDAKYPTTSKEVTPFIKKVTKLWRYSWLTDPLKDIIKELEFEMNR